MSKYLFIYHPFSQISLARQIGVNNTKQGVSTQKNLTNIEKYCVNEEEANKMFEIKICQN